MDTSTILTHAKCVPSQLFANIVKFLYLSVNVIMTNVAKHVKYVDICQIFVKLVHL